MISNGDSCNPAQEKAVIKLLPARNQVQHLSGDSRPLRVLLFLLALLQVLLQYSLS